MLHEKPGDERVAGHGGGVELFSGSSHGSAGSGFAGFEQFLENPVALAQHGAGDLAGRLAFEAGELLFHRGS